MPARPLIVIACLSLGLGGLLVGGVVPAQQAPATPADPKKEATATVVDEAPLRQPPSATDENGKSVPPVSEKLVLADPATKRYMPCRDASESSETGDASKAVKLNPKAAVLTEEAARQHGYKPSPHKVDCPK